MYIPKKTRIDGIYYQTRAAIVSEYSIRPVRFLSILFALIVGLGVLAFLGPIKAQLGEIVNSESNNAETTNEIERTDSPFISIAEITARSSQPNEYFEGNYEVIPAEDTIKLEKSDTSTSQTEVKLIKEVGSVDRTKDVSVLTNNDALTIESKDQGLTAGAYKVETINKETGKVLNDQKVLWGVLAFNPDYAVYPVGKEAFFSMAVLDDRGKMVCSASMTVEVTDPNGKVTTLNTADGTVRVNKDCEVYGKTDKPDYEANYQPKAEGDYKVKIVAKAGEGTRTLHDQFSVKADQDFYLQRVGATRTYPPVDYDYIINFEAKKAGSYTLTEKVPSSFEIKDSTENCQTENSLRSSEQPATLKIENCKLKIVENGDQKLLTWDFSIATDQVVRLAYAFKTPNISPYLFELGPAEVNQLSAISNQQSAEPTAESREQQAESWTEPRSWLIASDNACQSSGTGSWSSSLMWTSCGGTTPQSTDTVTILNTHNITMDVSPTVIDVTINNGGTLTVSTTNAITVSGNWSNSGTFTAATGTVTFSSTATGKTLGGTMTGATGKFYNIVFNGVGGGWTLNAALEAANNFDITNGTFDTNGASSYAVTVTGNVTLANTSGVLFYFRGSTITVSGSWSDVGFKVNTSGANQVILDGTGTVTNGAFCKLSIAYSTKTTTLSSNSQLICSTGNTPLLTFNGGTATSASSYTEIYNNVSNTPFSFASATTLSGTRLVASYANAAGITVSIPAGNYGSWNMLSFHTSGNSSTTQLSGNYTSTGYFYVAAANAVTGSIFNTQNYSLTASIFQFGDSASRVGAYTANFGSSTISLTSTSDSLLPTANGTTAYALNLQTSSVTVYGNTKFINASSTITLNAGTSTVTYAAVATGKTITSNAQSFYKVVFNGSGGGWTIQDAMIATNNFDITNGTFDTKSGSNYALTVGGNFTGNSGTWYFEMRASTITVSGNWDTSAIAADYSSLLYATSTVVMDGTGTKTIKTGSTNVWTSRFYNLNVGQAGGKTTQMLQSFGVNNVFTLGAGTFDLNSLTLEMESPPTNPLSLSGTFGTGNGRLEFYGGTASVNLLAYTYNSQVSNGLPSTYSLIFQGTTTITSDLVVSNCCSRANITNLNGQTVTVGHVTWSDAAGILTAGAATLNVTGNWTNALAGTFNKDTSTVNFTSTSTGKTITSGGRSFYNLTFNGSGGGWTPQDALAVTNDLTMTAGTLSGTQNVTVNGAVAGTAGIISLTGGTFKQMVASNKNFGTTSGSTAWTFNNLTFTTCIGICSPTITITTQTGGTGGITVSGILTVGDTGDSSNTALNAGNRTWTLSGTGGDPFQLHATKGSLVGATSTFTYTGANAGGNTTVQVATYCNLSIGGAAATDTYVLEGATVTSNAASCGDLTIVEPGVVGNNVLDVVSGSNWALTIGGNFLNGDTFSAQAGTVTFNATDSGNTLSGNMTGASAFYNLTFNGVAGGWTYSNAVAATNDFTVTNGAVTANNLALTVTRDFTLTNTAGVAYTAGSSTVTVSRHWTDNGYKFVYGTSTVVLNGTGTFTTAVTYYLNSLSMGYSGLTTTFNNPSATTTIYGTLTFNGGTVTANAALYKYCTSTCATPVVFASPTTLNGSSGQLIYTVPSANVTVTIPGADYGTWTIQSLVEAGATGAEVFNFGGNVTTTGNYMHRAKAATTITLNTQNYSLTAARLDLGSSNSTVSTTTNFGSSVITLTSTVDSLQVTTDSGSHSLNLQTSTVNIYGSTKFLNGTGTVTVNPGTSTVNMLAVATGKTITSNAQSFYNLVFNGVGGGWIIQDAMSVTNNFSITNGTFDTKSGSNYALTVGGNLTGNAGTWSFEMRASTITVSGNWDTSAIAADSSSLAYATSTVVMDGASTKTIKTGSTNTYNARFYNLNVGQAGGKTTQMLQSFGVDNVLTLGAGTIDLNSMILFMVSPPTNPLSLSGTFGTGNGTLYFHGGTASTNLPAYTYNSSFINALPNTYSVIFQGTTTFTGDMSIGGCCNRSNITNLNGQTVTVNGNVLWNVVEGILTMGAATLNVGGNWTNSVAGTFNANTSTVNFTSTSTGKTITSGGRSFYNLTFNGSGGGWTPQDALSVTNDLTMTAGTLSGTQNVTVNGAVAGTAGIISLTGGTFEQRVATSKNFGTTSGTTAWTFSSLTFSNPNTEASINTVTTQTGGSGGITVSGVLRIGKAGDVDQTVLNAGNRIWTLSGTAGDPFQILASPLGALTGGTSKFYYTGANAGGNTTIQSTPGSYYDLELNAADTFVLEADTVVTNNLTITHVSAILDVTVAPYALTIGGNYSNSGTFTARTGTVTLNGSATQTLSGGMLTTNAFYNLTLTNSSGTSPSDNERTGWVAGIDFNAAATITNNYTITTANVRVEYNSGSTYTIANINWNGAAIGTRIYFRNSAITGTWLLNVSGTQTAVSYVNVSRSDASSGSAIVASDGTNFNAQNNTNWTFGSTVTGTVYGTDETTAVVSGPTVRMYINGTTTETTTANGSGVFTFTTGANANDVLSIYLDTAGGITGMTVTKATGSALSNIHIYQDRLTTRCDNSCSLTNANIDNWDKGNDTDIHATAASGGPPGVYNLTVDNDWKLKVANNTFAPGGTVTTTPAGGSSYQGQVGIDASATLNMAGSALSIGGNYSNSGTFTPGSNTTTFTDTATGNTLAGTMTGASSFYNIIFDGVAGGWTYSNAVAATNDFTVTNGAVTANNLALTVTRDFTLANTAGVAYTAGSSTLTISRHFNDAGNKFVYGTSTVAMNGTGTLTTGADTFYNLSVGYPGFTTTMPNAQLTIWSGGTLILNGGTVDSPGSSTILRCVGTCSQVNFVSPTSLTGSRILYYRHVTAGSIVNLAGGDYGSWSIATDPQATTGTYNLAGNITTTSSLSIRGNGSSQIFNSQNYSIAINSLLFTSGIWTENMGSSAVTISGDFAVETNGGTHTLNLQTSISNIGGNITYINGTGTVTVTPGTSTVNMTATSTGKTITSNAQSFYNLVFNGVGGGWTFQDATIATNDFTVTNGAVTANNLALTVTRDFTLANTSGVSYTAGSSTLTISRHFNDTGNKFVYGTSTVTMNGTGSITTGVVDTFYNLNIGYSGFTTTQASTSYVVNNALTLNGGTVNNAAGTSRIQLSGATLTFASPTTLTGSGAFFFWAGSNTIPGGDYGNWTISKGTSSSSNTWGLGGNVTTTGNFNMATYSGTTGNVFNTNNYNLTAASFQLNYEGPMLSCRNGAITANFGSSIVTLTGTGNALYSCSTQVIANQLNLQTSSVTSSGSVLFVNTSSSINVDPGTSTLTWNNTSGTATFAPNGQSLYNMTLNGSGGTVTPSAAVIVTNDLTMTAGTLSGTQNVTVNGAVAGTAGIISLTGGTFKQMVASDKNFGTTSGSTAWTFSNLSFTTCIGICNPTVTITTQTGGTGGITVTGVLTVGDVGDSSITALNAGNRTWTLSGTGGDPFQLTASPAAVLTPATSTFKYTGNNGAGNTTVQSTTYNNLEINDGLVGYWKMDEGAGTNAANVSGNGGDATLGASTATPTWSTDTKSNDYYGGTGSNPHSLSFDGGDDVDTSIDYSWAVADSFSMSFWVKPTNVTGSHGIMGKPSGNWEWSVYTSGTTIVFTYWNTSGGNEIFVSSTVSINTWDHFVVTYDPTNKAILYKNGSSVSTDATVSNALQNRTNTVHLGQTYFSGAQQYFIGLLDDVRFYDRSLGTGEVTSLAAGNHPTYETYVLEADTVVTGNLGVRTGSLDVTASNFALTVGGNLTNVSNFAPNSGTVTMNSTASGKTIQSDPAFYKLKFHNASGGGGWTSQNRLLVDTTSGTPAADALVIGNGTVTIGDGSADNLLVYGGIDIAVNANETGILQTVDGLAEGSTITLQVNKDTATQCANCIVDVGASSGSGQGTLTINENGILKLIPKSSATASDTGVEVASTGKLNVTGAISLAETTSTAITDYDIRETKLCAASVFTASQFNSMNVRATSGLAIGQIYAITATTVNDAQCDTGTHDSITRADTSTASVVSASKTLSNNNGIMSVCIPDSITADNQKIGSYMRDFTGTKGYFQIVDSANDSASCTGTDDLLKVIESPDIFSGFTSGDTVDISDGVRPGDNFEIYDYAHVTAEDGVACTATVNEAGESYINTSAGSETIMNYADVCNLGRNAGNKYGVTFNSVNGTNASEGVTIDRSRLRSGYRGPYLSVSPNNNTGNSKGITNSSSTSNLSYGFHLAASSNTNTLSNNIAMSNTSYGFYLQSSANSNTLTSNTAIGNASVGFYLNSSTNNTLTSNTAVGNTSSDFELASSSNNTLTSNTATGNTITGFRIASSSNSNTLTSNTATGTSYGFLLYSTARNNIWSSNTATGNSRGFRLEDSSNNTLISNIATGNTNYGFELDYGTNNNTFMGNQSGGQPYGLYITGTAAATGNRVINDVYGATPNTTADIAFANTGAHTLSLYNTTLSSSTEVSGVSAAGAYIVSRKHDTSAGVTKIWGEYAIPTDTAETPQDEDTDKFNYANNLWEKSVTPHGYSGTGTEDTDLAYDLTAPADLSGGPYSYRLVTKTAGVGASCATSQAVMDVYRNGTDVGDLTTGTLFTDSTGAVNTKFTVDCGTTPYALNATYTFTAYDADNSTSTIKPMTMMQDGDIFTVGSGKTLEMKGQTTATNLTTVTRGASGGYHFNVAGTIDAQYYKFSYLGGTSGGNGLDLQSGATITNLDDGEFDNFQNVGATDTYITVHGSLIGSGAPAKTWDNMTFVEASDNVPEFSVTQTATGAPAAGNYWSFFGSTCTGWTDCEASDSDTGDGGTDTYGFLHFSSSVSVQGVVYLANESTIGTSGNGGPCDGSTAVITARVNGGSAATATCSASTAAYTVYLAITPTAGQTITIYLTSASKGNTVTLSDGATDTGVDIYIDHVVVRHENAGPQTNAGLDLYDIDQNATDMLFTVDLSEILTITAGKELHITTGKTFTPGGAVTTGLAGDVHIAGTLSMGGSALSIGGSYNNTGTFTSASNTTTFTSTATGKTLAGTMTGASSFYNLVFDGVAGGWTYSAAVAATNDFTVTNGAVTAGNQNLTVTRDFTLANTAGVSYTAGSSTLDIARHFNDTGNKFVYGTSTVSMTGTGTATIGNGLNFFNLNLGYTGFTTTLSNNNLIVRGQLFFNGGTVSSAGSYLSIYCAVTCTPIVFNSATTLSGTRNMYLDATASAVTTTIAAGDYGSWKLTPFVTSGSSTSAVYNLAGNITTTQEFWLEAAVGSTGNVFNTQNFSLTALRLSIGDESRTASWTMNLGSSSLTFSSVANGFMVASNGGSHTLNMSTSLMTVYGNLLLANGTGNITTSPGTSTVTFAAVATGKTITSNAQSFYNLVFNGVGGGWTFQDATIATNDFTVTNGAVTANNLALTVTRDFTLANTAGVSYTAGSSTVTVSRHWNDTGTKFVYGTSTVALNGTGTIAVAAAASFNNLSVGYSTFTTTFPSASGGWSMTGQLTFNGGTVTNAGGGTWFYIRVNGTNNTPFVFASPTTITGINAPGLWTSANGPYTVTVAGGNYGSWSQNLWAAHTGVTFQLGGNVTTTGNFSQRNTVGGDTIFNTQNYDLTANNYQFGHSGGTGCLATTANWGSSTITLANTSNALYVNSNCGTHNLNMQTSNLSLKGHILFANGTGAITNNAGTSTTTFTNTSTTANTTLNGQTLYNSTLNGSGGTVTPLDAMVVTNDLTMTAGTLNGTQNVTVNGAVAGTAGIISLTGGTFEQRVGAAKNFGTTSGSTAWTFYDLTFSNGTGDSSGKTITTQTGGTGGITVSDILRVGKSGDSAGETTTLDAGNRTWTLSGTGGDPFQLLASPAGALTAATSTFKIVGGNSGGNTTVQATSYYSLELSCVIACSSDTFVLEGSTTATNNFNNNNNSTLDTVSGQNYALTLGGNYTNAGSFIARNGTVTFNSTATGKTLNGNLSGQHAFYNLVFDGVGGGWTFNAAVGVTNDFTVTNGAVTANNLNLTVTRDYTLANTSGVSYTAGSSTITVTRHFNDSGNKFVYGTSTITMNGDGTFTHGNSDVFYNLNFGYTGFTTTLSANNALVNGQLSFNGGTVTGSGTSYLSLQCTVSCTPVVFNAATSLTGVRDLFLKANATGVTMSIAGGNYGSWGLRPWVSVGSSTSAIFNLTGNITATSRPIWFESNSGSTGTVFNTQNYTITTTQISFGEESRTASWTANFGSSTLTLSASDESLKVASNGGSHTLNMGSASIDVKGNVLFANGTGTIAVTPGTSTLTWTHTSGTKTYAPNGQSLYNVVLNASGGTVLPTGAVIATNNFTITAGTYDTDVTGNYALTIGGSYSNSGTFTARAGTVTFNATASGKTMAGTMVSPSAFYNLTFNGSGGEWTPSSAVTATNDLTMTAGTLLGTQNVTVNGNVAGTAGIINLTGGTFEQRVSTNKNFGTTSGSTAWTFNDLKYSYSGMISATITTQTGGSGGINVGGVLYLGNGSDEGGTTLNAGNRTWTLSGTGGDPFQICAFCSLTAATSTFKYTGNNTGGTTTIEKTTSGYNNLEINDGLQGYWKLDETTTTAGATVMDVSGNANTGTPNGTGGANNLPQPSTDVPNVNYYGGSGSNPRSLNFDGTDDYVSTPDNAAYAVGTGPITLSAWVNFNAGGLGVYQGIISQNLDSFELNKSSGNKLRMEMKYGDGTAKRAEESVASLTASSTWYHVVGVFYPSTGAFELYVNGASRAVSYVDAQAGGTLKNSSATVLIGARAAGSLLMNGKIDDVRIYNRALGTTEITSLAAGNHPTYETYVLEAATTVNGNLGVRTGSLDVTASNFALNVFGNYTNVSNFGSQAGTVTMKSTATGKTVQSDPSFYNIVYDGVGGGWTYQNRQLATNDFTVTNGAVTANNLALTVTRDFTLANTSGVSYTAGSSTIAVSRHFNDSGNKFSAGTSTLIMDGTGTLTHSDGELLYNLSIGYSGFTTTLSNQYFVMLSGSVFTLNGGTVSSPGSYSHIRVGPGTLSGSVVFASPTTITGSRSWVYEANSSTGASSTVTVTAGNYGTWNVNMWTKSVNNITWQLGGNLTTTGSLALRGNGTSTGTIFNTQNYTVASSKFAFGTASDTQATTANFGSSTMTFSSTTSGLDVTSNGGSHTLNMGSSSIDVKGNVLFANGTGSIAVTPGTSTLTWTHTSGTKTYAPNGQSLYNVVLNASGGTVQPSGAVSVEGDFTITAGTYDTVSGQNYLLTLYKNFTNNGTFLAQQGEVYWNGITSSAFNGTFTGSSSLYNLSIYPFIGAGGPPADCERASFVPDVDFNSAVTATGLVSVGGGGSAGIEFQNGTTYNFNDINFNGFDASNRVFLRNSAASGSWNLNVTAVGSAQTKIKYVNVSRSDASSGAQIIASDGTNVDCNNNVNWMFDEELIITLDATSKNFGTLTPGSNPTDQTSTVTVTTNANNGYIVYAWTDQPMTFGSWTIPDWAGTNTTPTTWPNGSYGFGYSTDDASLTGGTADRFTNGGPKFAGFGHSGPGDPVADRTSPATAAQNIVTYRLAPDSTQTAGIYQATVIYVASVRFP